MKIESQATITPLLRLGWIPSELPQGRGPALLHGGSGGVARSRRQKLVIVGGGPAGLAPLFAAANKGNLHELLEQGVTIVEAGEQLGAGALSQYAISSDSAAVTFLDFIKGTSVPQLQALQNHPAALKLQTLGVAEAPLALVADWLKAAGEVLHALVAGSRYGRVLTHTRASYVRQMQDGGWITHVHRTEDSRSEDLVSERVVLTNGAHQPVERLQEETVAGMPLLPRFGHKLVQSGVVLARGGADLVRSRLRGIAHPRVAIIGGSTSAAAIAVLLLQQISGMDFVAGGVTLLHRKPIRICYGSVEEAISAGDTTFTPDDVCPLTGRVYRFSGLRLSSRDLLMRAQGLGSEPVEPRLRLLSINDAASSETEKCLANADLIVAALGYRPLLLPVQNVQGRPVALHVPSAADWAVVDSRYRVRRWDGRPLENLHASGLAVGPVPDRSLGGELGFRGQVNSLWMWQHNLGHRLLEEITAPSPKPRYRGMKKMVYMPSAEPLGLLAVQGGAR